ncbi:Spo0B domain-containing protein [Thermoflavimicrobium dichotomicum]|uniref:Sensor_kinase_SpoOB-type, alpha-helical domain n=1 Tax=Thermoflavimicrobium dichotomicum TaxID=46223 RepID=A0A1I3R5Q2_9BACL|nr:Spo0B domain-containing protein [Thermoflavimicrobium dichotomicum]SFJ41668.1 Sensor_kinase_SpoOB-type, alpha-helical domain [Thermoflavimicrobium dichotomicum]
MNRLDLLKWRFFLPAVVILSLWVFQPWGRMGSVCFLILSLLSIFLGVHYWQKEWQRIMVVSEAERIRELMSKQRHDWLNHIQVLMGYQMLKKPEQISRYLQKLMKEAERERQISRIRYAPLAVFLLTLGVKYKEWEWDVELADSMIVGDETDAVELLRLLECMVTWLKKQGEEYLDWTKIQLRMFSEKKTVSMEWKLLDDDGNIVPLDFPQTEWEEIQQKMRKQGAQVLAMQDQQLISLHYAS